MEMKNKPYFCPNCRSNRTKFSILSSSSRSFMKDAVTGEIIGMDDPVPEVQEEPMIRCNVCHFVGNENRFVKQAEREPRTVTSVQSFYR